MKQRDWSYSIRAQDSIAQGALTNSKRPECFVKGVYQTHLRSARGPYVTDVSGHVLFDFICGMGSMLIGHGNHNIANAIYQRAIDGITLSLGSVTEIQLAEKIKEVLPWVQKVKFLKSGSEACSAAIKIARAKTGKDIILSDGYHGWHDQFVSLTQPALGVPPQSGIYPLREDLIETAAAVIVEPIMTDISKPRVDFLRRLRELCDKSGTLLIFDEVITGFRFPKFTVSNYFGIEPDIICLGKAMGGGLPLACVGGKDLVMNCGEYFVSSTFAGETCSMAASLQLIQELQTNKFNLNELWAVGGNFQEEFNKLYPEKIRLVGYPTRAVFEGDQLVKALLWQEAYKAGILFGSSFFFSFAHMPYSERILNILNDIIIRIKTDSVLLDGELPQSPFAQKMREKK